MQNANLNGWEGHRAMWVGLLIIGIPAGLLFAAAASTHSMLLAVAIAPFAASFATLLLAMFRIVPTRWRRGAAGLLPLFFQ